MKEKKYNIAFNQTIKKPRSKSTSDVLRPSSRKKYRVINNYDKFLPDLNYYELQVTFRKINVSLCIIICNKCCRIIMVMFRLRNRNSQTL